ncbi:MAG: hypothetical protein RLZZ352_2353 [Pseudomonadota bacterium]|jgi:Ca2+-binding RTX toxin-like protein
MTISTVASTDGFVSYNFSGNAAGYRVNTLNGLAAVVDIDFSNGNQGTTTLTSGNHALVFADRNYSVQVPGKVGVFPVNTTKVGDQSDPAVSALTGGGYVLTWQSYNQDGSGYGIYAQRFDGSGNILGAETRINTTTVGEQTAPTVTALSGGGYVITWQGIGGNGYNIYAQRFDASGNALGSETCINTITGGGVGAPAVSALSNGGYVVTWESVRMETPNNPNFYSDIYTQRFDVSGNALGIETRVNTYTRWNQNAPAVTGLNDGGYVVTWQSNYGTSNNDIYAQRFDASGNPLGIETRVNTATDNDQSASAVTALGGGGYVVTWQSANQDGSGWGIYAQRFDASGNRLGVETRVNTTTASNQFGSAVTTLGGGGYLVTWAGDTAGADQEKNIYVQRFDDSGNPIGAEFVVSTNAIASAHPTVVQGPTVTGLGNGGYLVAWRGNDGRTDDRGIFALQLDVNNLPAVLVDLTGTSQDDVLQTGAGRQRLFGEAGNDTLDGGAGADFMVGGEGSDTYVVDDLGDVVQETGNTAGDVDTVRINRTFTLDATIENLILTGTSRLNGTGNASDNLITGNSGNNYLIGLAGNDTLDGFIGADTMAGGTGDDLYRVGNTGDVVIEAANEGTDTVESNISYTLGAYLEHLTLIETRHISGTGNSQNNRITGNSGNNTLDGGTGADTLTGGLGNDTYIVDNAGDVVTETSTLATEVDMVRSSVSFVLGSNLEQLWLTGADATDATGNGLNNVLSGNIDENVLNGMDGIDTASYADAAFAVEVNLAITDYQYTVGDGFDRLISIENLVGSAFNDSLAGDIGANQLEAGDGNDTLDGAAGNDTLIGGNGADGMTGGAGNDRFEGGDGNDTLEGGAGNDTLIGGSGGDVMSGGEGNDVYHFTMGDRIVETGPSSDWDAVLSTTSYRLGDNIEKLSLLGSLNINGTGNSLNNYLDVNLGNNVMDGGAGTDTVSYLTGSAAGVTVNLDVTTAQNTGGSGIDTLLNVENLIGSNFDDHLIGNARNNQLNGSSGNDILLGGAGRDTLTGGAGNDIFDFNALSDLGLGSTARDVITDFTVGQDKMDLSTIDANTVLAGDQAFAFVTSFTTTAGQVRYSGGIVYLNTDADVDAEFEIALTGVVPTSLSATDFVL